MSVQKFQLSVSGFELKDSQLSHISGQLNAALISALVGPDPKRVAGTVWSKVHLNGGILIAGLLAEELNKVAGVREVEGP